MLKTAGQSPIGQAVVVEQVPESLDDRLSATIAAYDHISAEYACRFASGDLRGHRLRFQERMAPDSPVLDAGCGAGRDCNFLANDGFAAVGLDHSAGLLSQARKLTRAPLVRGDIRSLPFADSFFDGVWCCAVLVHLPPSEALRALTEMQRVLAVDGALFVSVRHGNGTEWRTEEDGWRRWFQLYTPEGISALARESGFAILDLSVEPGVVSPGRWINMHAKRL